MSDGPPEVLQGSYGSKCDMWSMGVIAYMMVSGAPPFWGNGDAQVGHSADRFGNLLVLSARTVLVCQTHFGGAWVTVAPCAEPS